MSKSAPVCVITTIHPPTECLRQFAQRFRDLDSTVIVAGDKKGPQSFDLAGTELLTLDDQLASPFQLAGLLPVNHYVRKNVAYLTAMRMESACIYETDDDNRPADSWAPRAREVAAWPVQASRWVNVFRWFSDELIWPRGFPLEHIRSAGCPEVSGAGSDSPTPVTSPIQQGLADKSPDVDAVWRLTLDRPFFFDQRPSVRLAEGNWCPFNSQSTWWWPEVYPLMYLPSFCTFRMTDIWRSFVAQRCLWEMGFGVVFHGAEVVQDRNEHDLHRDFLDEIPGYERNDEMIHILEDEPLGADTCGNLARCYEALFRAGFFPEKELALVYAWINDVGRALDVGQPVRLV